MSQLEKSRLLIATLLCGTALNCSVARYYKTFQVRKNHYIIYEYNVNIIFEILNSNDSLLYLIFRFYDKRNLRQSNVYICMFMSQVFLSFIHIIYESCVVSNLDFKVVNFNLILYFNMYELKTHDFFLGLKI